MSPPSVPALSPADDGYRWRVLGVVMLGTVMSALDSSIVNVSLPNIMASFGASVDDIEWVVTGYMLGFSTFMPLTAWLRDRVGYKVLYVASLAVFIGGSALCGLAPNLPALVLARVIQAFGGGAITPTGLAMIAEVFPPKERGRALGLWGVGVVVYLALWALVPVTDAGGPDPAPEFAEEPSGPPRVSYVLLTAALFLGLVISTSWWGGPSWGGGLGLAWLLVLFAVVVVALRRPARRLTIGRALLTLALIVLSLIILVTGAFFGAVAMTGVPLTGGIGQRVVQPITSAELQPTYRLAVGSLTVDLTHVPLGAVARTVTASVAVGQLVVDVPRGVVVDVDAHAGIGAISYGAAGPGAFAVPLTAFGPARPQLVIDAQVGIGLIRLQRGGL